MCLRARISAPSIREEYKGKFKDSPLRPAASSKKKSGGFEAALASANAASKRPRDEKKRPRER